MRNIPGIFEFRFGFDFVLVELRIFPVQDITLFVVLWILRELLTEDRPVLSMVLRDLRLNKHRNLEKIGITSI